MSAFSYQQTIDASERVAWRIDDILPETASLDFTRPHLPEALTHISELDCLNAEEKLKLNHIRGHSYMNLFAFVEEYIIAQVVRHAQAEMFGDHDAIRALLRFGEEEVKHQTLFLRYCQKFRQEFGSECRVLGQPADVAQIILSKSPIAVMLTTLHLELMTQAHFVGAIKDHSELDPTFVSILRHHWQEEAQHTKIDVLELDKLVEEATEADIQTALADYLGILAAFDGLLLQQVDMDIESLQEASGRSLQPAEHEAVRRSQQSSYRLDFLVMGMQNPLFLDVVESLAPGRGRALVEQAARSYQ